MYPSPADISERLKAAREAVSPERNRVADAAGLADETLAAYEGAKTRGQPKWVRPIQYMAFLAGKNVAARREILTLLGIAPAEVETSPALQVLFETVREAHGHPNRLVRATLASLVSLLEVALQENPADQGSA